jgi:hypothetical protein
MHLHGRFRDADTIGNLLVQPTRRCLIMISRSRELKSQIDSEINAFSPTGTIARKTVRRFRF